jgi:hypothetical protein
VDYPNLCIFQLQTIRRNFHIFSIMYHNLLDCPPTLSIQQHGQTWREGDQEQVTMCYLETTVRLSQAIDRQSVSVMIVGGQCDVCSEINSVTFVTDEQNALSLCLVQDPANLVAVRIGCLSVRCIQPHMYPQSSAPSDV